MSVHRQIRFGCSRKKAATNLQWRVEARMRKGASSATATRGGGRWIRRLFGILGVVLLTTVSLSAGDGLEHPDVERRVEALLQQMTLDEKVGQLVQYSAGNATGPASDGHQLSRADR